MKTTLDLPDDLLRAMKIRAVQEGRKFKEVAAEVFRRGLAQPEPSADRPVRRRVKLPLIQCRHAAVPGSEPTAEQVAAVLLNQEAEWSREAAGR